MNTAAGGRRGSGPGRLDPTVRGLLRAFLSPAVADRYASALQPIAVADRDAALAGAVSTLRARFFVPAEEIAVALVSDAGWSVADVATMLGMPSMQVRAALRAAADAEPRIGAAPPQGDEVEDEAAAVAALLAGLPRHRRDAATAAEEGDEDPADVELSTALPAHVGLPSLEAQLRRSDRMQRLVVNGTIVAIVVLVALTLDATRPDGTDDVALPGPTLPSPTAPATPDGATDPTAPPDAALPVGVPVLAEARFVASVDPATGEPGPTLDPATTADDPRLWLRLEQLPRRDLLLTLRFTAPSGRSTVRPVLVADRTPLVSVRLPDELGRAPGRYAARIEAEDLEPRVVELTVVEDA